jgi:type IV secretion system protein VirB9
MRPVLILIALLAGAAPSASRAADDPRFLTLDYGSGGMFHVQTTPETSQMVLFAPGERIQSVIVSDPGAYQIGVTGTGDGITVKANGMSALAIVSVQTDQRAYQLELVPGNAASAPSVVRFSYASRMPAAAPPAQDAEQVAGFGWRLSGNRTLRPVAMRDDGTRTYMEWGDQQALPAVFAIGASGEEEIVEGYMRGGVLTIDRVYPELVFRIDRTTAAAKRVEEKQRRDR